MTTTALALDQKLLETIGDFKQHPVTTALTTSASVVSTHLTNYRNTADYFNDYWIFIEDNTNASVSRIILDDDGANTLTVRGSSFAAETPSAGALATFRITKTSWANRLAAINRALEDLYPRLFEPLDDRTLVTGNILPNAHFEDWAVATAPDFYSVTNATSAVDTTAGQFRGGTSSAKVSSSAADGYMYISSNTYPRLLDLQGRTVHFRAWVYPEVADDAFLTIYTVQADGTAQTLNSTTTCPLGKWTLLELNDQALNDHLVEIQFRFRIHTNAKYAVFDNARVTGLNVLEYLIPDDFQDGAIHQVYRQTGGNSTYACDDLLPTSWDRVFGYEIIDSGSYKYLELPFYYPQDTQLRLIGDKPFTALTTSASTVSFEGRYIRMFTEYAAFCLFDAESQTTSAEDKSRYEREAAKHYAHYDRLKRYQSMPRVSGTMKLQVY